MALQPFLSVLESTSGVKKDNKALLIPEELETTLFVTLGRDVMQLPKLIRLEVQGDLVVLGTQKGEKYFFATEQVVGLSFGSANAKAARSGAGFLPAGSILSR